MTLPKATIQSLWRVVAFLIIFVIVSGFLGAKIINGGILYRDGFAVYGGLGKAAIFGLIAFLLLARNKARKLDLIPWHPKLLIWMGVAFYLFIVAWMSINNLVADERTVQNILLAHFGLILCIFFAALGFFGAGNLLRIWQTYKYQLVQAVIIAGGFFLFLLLVYSLWLPLATIVLTCVNGLLILIGISTEIMEPNILLTDKFGITIAQYCSGIESIALFTGLYIIVGLLERQRLHLRRYLTIFPLAIIILFGLNIFRVFALIAAGYYYNPEIAFSLFHSYAGMMFFVLYSIIFWGIAYKYIIKTGPIKKDKGNTS